MSYERGTAHYNLPQTQDDDTRDWFDTNEAFADIDAAIWAAKETAEAASGDLTQVEADIVNLQGKDVELEADITDLKGRTETLERSASRTAERIEEVNQDLKDSICAIEEASATAAYQHLTGEFFWYNDTLYKATQNIAVGQQIVPDTNCSTTNITTELLNGSSGLEPRVAALETDMGTLMFRNDGGSAQYSLDGGTTWVNFKNPVGTKSITANGTYDVTDYASADVSIQGDYTGFGATSVTITKSYSEAYWFATSASDSVPQTIAAPTGSAVVSATQLDQQRVVVTGTANYAAAVFKLVLQPGTLTKYGVGALVCIE